MLFQQISITYTLQL